MSAQNIFISELLPEADLAYILEKHETGLELICLSVSENLDRYGESIDKTREMLNRLNNPRLTLHGPFLDLNPAAYDSRIRQVTMERFAQSYDAALELNASRIIYHSGMIPTVYYLDGWAERVAEFFSEFLENRKEIVVCMENVLDREIMPFAEVIQMVSQMISTENFGICLDIGHAHCYSAHPVTEWAGTLIPYIKHIHIHDNNGTRDQHLALGSGNLPWKEVMDIIGKYSGAPEPGFTLECTDIKSVEDSLRTIEGIDHRSGSS